MKKYMKPAVELANVNTESCMVAASLNIGKPGALPEDALVREQELWDEEDEW